MHPWSLLFLLRSKGDDNRLVKQVKSVCLKLSLRNVKNTCWYTKISVTCNCNNSTMSVHHYLIVYHMPLKWLVWKTQWISTQNRPLLALLVSTSITHTHFDLIQLNSLSWQADTWWCQNCERRVREAPDIQSLSNTEEEECLWISEGLCVNDSVCVRKRLCVCDCN